MEMYKTKETPKTEKVECLEFNQVPGTFFVKDDTKKELLYIGKDKKIGENVATAYNLMMRGYDLSTFEEMYKALKWINDLVSTAADGGAAWCAVRERPGAEEWGKNMEAVMKIAKSEK